MTKLYKISRYEIKSGVVSTLPEEYVTKEQLDAMNEQAKNDKLSHYYISNECKQFTSWGN